MNKATLEAAVVSEPNALVATKTDVVIGRLAALGL